MSTRLQLKSKLPTEARTEFLDVSSAITGGSVLSTATASIVVYSGVDPSPSTILGAVSVNPPYNQVILPLNASGVVGTIYVITINIITTASGNSYYATFTTFLTVISDPL
jgi:hypothetical protein